MRYTSSKTLRVIGGYACRPPPDYRDSAGFQLHFEARRRESRASCNSCSLRLFSLHQIIAFLNKVDILRKKIKSGHFPLDRYLPGYKGESSLALISLTLIAAILRKVERGRKRCSHTCKGSWRSGIPNLASCPSTSSQLRPTTPRASLWSSQPSTISSCGPL